MIPGTNASLEPYSTYCAMSSILVMINTIWLW